MPQEINSRERVLRAIGGQRPDRIPKGELCLDDQLIKEALGCHEVSFPERLAFAQELGLDLITAAPGGSGGRRIPEPGESHFNDLERWMASGLFTFVLIDGPFEWGMRAAGFEEFLTMPAREPDKLRGLVEQVRQVDMALIEEAARKGCDGVILADDTAYRGGMLTSPRIWRRFFLPVLADLAAAVKRYNLPLFFHSDGNIGPMIPDLIRIGCDGLNCIERSSGLEAAQLRQEYGLKPALWGTLDPAHLAGAHHPEELAGIAGEIISLGKDGGFILGTSSGLFKGIDLEGLRLIYSEVAKMDAG